MIDELIGKDKLYEPPFHVAFESGNMLYPIIADSKGDMLCCGLYDIDIANHIANLLNEYWKDETR